MSTSSANIMRATDSDIDCASHGAPATFPVTVTKDEDYWFTDGSIVILCGDTGFRVHADFLAQYTAVFVTNASTEVFDGCPECAPSTALRLSR
ncbi:hypothetical protein FA95DRAFT_1559989 [Auriscalpium vulgare]|uniref:Uncharacterized protein n=1 Tax=Auriscalpium vulgare TaxID=40419 RepID=A0ACB8RSD3_9AGAM|nr:hypothetical protein FA95DRAFT_1559989 [Auriscalpium vulgare]